MAIKIIVFNVSFKSLLKNNLSTTLTVYSIFILHVLLRNLERIVNFYNITTNYLNIVINTDARVKN